MGKVSLLPFQRQDLVNIQSSKVLILSNEDARRRKYMWVLTCRRVCRGRSAIQEEEKEKKKIN